MSEIIHINEYESCDGLSVMEHAGRGRYCPPKTACRPVLQRTNPLSVNNISQRFKVRKYHLVHSRDFMIADVHYSIHTYEEEYEGHCE